MNRIAQIRRARRRYLERRDADMADDEPHGRIAPLILDDDAARVDVLTADEWVDDEVRDVVSGRVRAMEMGRL